MNSLAWTLLRAARTCAHQRSIDHGALARQLGIGISRAKRCFVSLGETLLTLEESQGLESRRTCRERLVAQARVIRVLPVPGSGRSDHGDAVNRAGRNAKFATTAVIGHHDVHLARSADDGVYRTGGDAQGAADAELLVDQGDVKRLVFAACSVKRQDRLSGQACECGHGCIAAGRTAVDRRAVMSNRLGIGAAAVVAALGALRLRQQLINFFGTGATDSWIHVVFGQRRPRAQAEARMKSWMRG